MKPRLVTVAGPNGCGKTTFAREYLESHQYPFLSADLIVDGMESASIDDVRLQAGRVFLDQVAEGIERGESFLVESTLSGLTFRETLRRAREQGYEITIVFVFLRSAEVCLARIQERVRKGGHRVAEADVRRRFSRSLKNFWREYRGLADHWHLFYNGGTQFHEVARGELDAIEVADEGLFTTFLGIAEEPIP